MLDCFWPVAVVNTRLRFRLSSCCAYEFIFFKMFLKMWPDNVPFYFFFLLLYIFVYLLNHKVVICNSIQRPKLSCNSSPRREYNSFP